MKKIITLVLSLLLCCSIFTACDFVSDSGYVDGSSSVTESSTAADAIAVVNSLYRTSFRENNVTATSFTVVSQVMVGTDVYPVTWTIEGTDLITLSEVDNYKYTVIIPEGLESDVEYTLTASVTDGTTTETASYALKATAYALNTFEEFMAASAGDTLTIRGIVLGTDSKNSIYLQDLNNKGGYYIYALSELPEGLERGMTVEATGALDIYYNVYELKNASVKIVDTTIKTVTPIDVTDLYTSAATVTDASLRVYNSALATIKGVTLGGQLSDSGYLYFTLGEKQTYLRYTTTYDLLTETQREALIKLHADNYGNIADVTGYISIYNNQFYLIPVDGNAITNITVPTRSDAEVVALEKGALSVTASINSDTTLTLPTAGTTDTNVVISWASDSEYAVVDGGKVTITVPDTKTTVTLTATITLNDVTETATFQIVLNKVPTSLADLAALGLEQASNSYTTEKYIAEGVITNIANTTYGNMTITDGEGNSLYIYGMYSADGSTRYDALETKPVVGDYIRLNGVVGQYNGTAQIKNARIEFFYTPVTLETVKAYTSETAPTAKIAITGTVSKTYGSNWATYGNMYVSDGTNEVLVYGIYDARGIRYDKLTVKPVVGDTITVYGTVSFFNSTVQIKNATIVYYAKGTTTETTCPGCGSTTEVHEKCGVCGEYLCKGDHTDCTTTPDPEVLTIADALAKAEGTTVTIKGVVTSIYQAWNDEYGNISVYISDSTGTILVFRTTTNCAVNDIITVTGKTTVFTNSTTGQSSTQIAAGATATINGQHTEHSYADGKCTICGTIEPASADNPNSYNLVSTDVMSEMPASGYNTAEFTINGAKFTFSRVSKQTTTITDRPVMGANSSKDSGKSYLTVDFGEKTISSVTFNVMQWGSKTFNSITVEYYNGSEWVTCGTLTSLSGETSITGTFESATQVRLCIATSKSNNVQLGITSVVVVPTTEE